jgi:hypothetical protein
MPKKDKFFALSVRRATIGLAGAEALQVLLKSGDTVEQYCRDMFDREAAADELTCPVFVAVRHNPTYGVPTIRSVLVLLVGQQQPMVRQ